jgi:hypothetical protein
MDVYPRTQIQCVAVKACLASIGKDFAPNPAHRCSDECRYYRFKNVAVCKQSLHTHLCGPHHCKNPELHTHTPEGTTCRLTGIVVAGPQEIQAPKLAQDGTFKRHWEIQGAHPARTKRRKAQAAADAAAKLNATIEKTCKVIFASDERRTAAAKATRKTADRAARAAPSPASFNDIMTAIAAECIAAGNAIIAPPQDQTTKGIANTIKAATRFITAKGFKSKNPAITAAAILSLMQHGFKVNECTMVERHAFPNRYLPTQAQLGTMKGLQCRAITLAIRAIKRFMVTPKGDPRPQHAIIRENYKHLLP